MSGSSGKHNPDDVIIGMMDSPEVKALAELVAEADKCSNFSDWMRRQIFNRAEINHILAHGKVVPEWRDRVKLRAENIRTAKRVKAAARAASKAANKNATTNH